MPTFSQVSNDNEDEVYKINARAGHNDFVPGQVLVKFKDESPVNVSRTRGMFSSVNKSAVDAVLKEFGVETMDKLLPNAKPLQTRRKTRAFNGEVIEEKDLSQIYIVKTKSLRKDSTMQLVKKLKEIGEVEYAEPNYKVYIMGQVPSSPAPQQYSQQRARTRAYTTETTDDVICSDPSGNPLYSEQWGLEYEGLPELWKKPIINKKRPVIAILDTGVDITHPDLVDNIWTKPGTDDEHGYDFINETANIRDNNMHGTHVAGIAAASNNETGIVGANPQALIMPITVMQSDGTGDIAIVVKGIEYAVENGATVLNLSLGSYAYSSSLRQALEKAYQSAVIVASAGNDNMRIHPEECSLDHKCDYGKMYPAAFSFVLGVQASTASGELASFSNHDTNGNIFSSELTALDPEGFNYELMAPGTNILSSVPDGNYKSLQGTSMAAPLVAGAISVLKMIKEYGSQEILWGDLLHTNTIAQAFDVKERPAELDVLRLMMRDRKELSEETEEDYSEDGRVDVGETINIFPVVRTTFGEASNIKLYLEMGDEYEDPSTVDIITGKSNKVDFGWHLDAYGKNVSANPLQLKVADGLADGRHIKMKVVATCNESNNTFEEPFTLIVDNIVKIHGIISEDMTLTADHVYYVDNDIAVAEGATFTIEPGTTVKFHAGKTLKSFGKLKIHGTPEKPIVLEGHIGEDYWGGIISNVVPRDTLKYCKLSFYDSTASNHPEDKPYLENCIITNTKTYSTPVPLYFDGKRCNVIDNLGDIFMEAIGDISLFNIINNSNFVAYSYDVPQWTRIVESNFFNLFQTADRDGKTYLIGERSDSPIIIKSLKPSYLGTSREDLVRPHVYEFGNTPSGWQTYAQVDLSNMLKEPVKEAHGIVWKVVVNGKDAQDEYEELDPLGVGKHKFEVYFNRPMNKEKIPQISFGVREPYTQNAVAEDGAWNDEGTIYTAYVTITGKTQSDGVNRIYVYGAEDDEFFECPYEKTRFNVNVQSAGSQSAGFSGEAGLGRVELDWNELKTDMTDVLGFNVYRYTTMPEDSVRVNDVTIDAAETHFTDYDVVPGTTYYYKYKLQSTDLKEYQPSNVVAVTPLTAKLGDVTGNNEVDVFDIVYEVNYILGQKPKAFVKCAADVNSDNVIDVLDVQGIIKTILNPSSASRTRSGNTSTAVYSIEDGVLYVESPVALGGVQVQVNVPEKTDITTLDDLKGFEQAGSWLSKNDYLFMAYNMKGKTLAPGKHALLRIGDGDVTSITIGDANGMKMSVTGGDGTTAIDNMATAVKTQKGIYNLKGQKVAGSADELRNLPKGIYIVDGIKVLK